MIVAEVAGHTQLDVARGLSRGPEADYVIASSRVATGIARSTRTDGRFAIRTNGHIVEAWVRRDYRIPGCTIHQSEL